LRSPDSMWARNPGRPSMTTWARPPNRKCRCWCRKQRKSIGRRGQNGLRSDNASTTRPIFNHDALPPYLSQLLRDDTHLHVSDKYDPRAGRSDSSGNAADCEQTCSRRRSIKSDRRTPKKRGDLIRGSVSWPSIPPLRFDDKPATDTRFQRVMAAC